MRLRSYHPGLILSVFSVVTALVESYKYPGFINKHFHFSPYYLYSITALSIIAMKLYPPPTPEKKLLPISFRYLAIAATLVTGLLLIFESINYPNYVFSSIHIHLEGAQILTVLIFIYFVLSNLKHSNYNMIITSTSLIAIMSLLINYAVANSINLSHLLIKEHNLMDRSLETDEEKQIAGWGDIYRYSKLLAESTPKDAKIALPPAQNHWLYSGNIVLMQYFLYPRRLINLVEDNTLDTLVALPNGDYEYIAMIWGESNQKDPTAYGWPKTDLNAESITYFDLTNLTYTTIANDTYKYATPSGDTPPKWGVIKLKH